MVDLCLDWGGDLALGPTGDLQVTAGTTLATQRVLRRLLTNGGDYLWHPDYGAGLRRFVGSPLDQSLITAIVRTEIGKEAAVALSPPATISVTPISGRTNSFYLAVSYVGAASAQPTSLTFSLDI
jgi:phage baseplate assembly protein W